MNTTEHAPSHRRTATDLTVLAALALAAPAALAANLPATPDAAERGSILVPVSNCNDSGTGSLRQALQVAGTGDDVDLSQLACDTITLTSGALFSNSGAGIVSLYGPTDRTLTINGSGSNRVLSHFGYRIRVYHLNLVNGRTSNADGDGGGVFMFSPRDLYIDNSTITANYSVFGFGAGVYLEGATWP